VADMMRLNSCSDNCHAMTLEEVMDGGSSLIKYSLCNDCSEWKGSRRSQRESLVSQL
jgi:hypothetical protein